MMIKKILCILIIGTVLTSCKKDEKISAPTSSSTVQDSPYTVSNATKYFGRFSSIWYTHTQTYNYSYSYAEFYDTASYGSYLNNKVPVSSVILNNDQLPIDSVNKGYVKEIWTPTNFGTEAWQIQGANGIHSFNYTSTNNTPNCENFNTIPDSISISAGITFTLNTINVTTTGMNFIEILDNSGHSTQMKYLQNGSNTISYTSNELINFSPTTQGIISISLENIEVLNFYGKDFQFLKGRSYNKVIKIKP